jgi:hypothetical protein
VTVNGGDATFDTNTAIWLMPELLVPGFNRFVIQARDVSGVVLAETNRDVVLQLASSRWGMLSGNTVRSPAILHVTGNVLVPEGGMTVEKDRLLLAPGPVRATNANRCRQAMTSRPDEHRWADHPDQREREPGCSTP